jgi:HSP20 family molecular chaperone IbpA
MERSTRASHVMFVAVMALTASAGMLRAAPPADLPEPVWTEVPQKRDYLAHPGGVFSLAEKADRYVVRMEFPGRDLSRITVRLVEGTFHVAAPEDGSLPPVQRDIKLPEAAPGGPLLMERADRQGVLVVTVPKAGTSRGEERETSASSDPEEQEWARGWEQLHAAMQRMQQQMEAMMAGGQDLGVESPASVLPSPINPLTVASMPEDHGDRYIVHVALPGGDPGKVNVSVKEGVLRIEATKESSRPPRSGFLGRFETTMTLPGPVQVGRMRVERQGQELVITLPKAETTHEALRSPAGP